MRASARRMQPPKPSSATQDPEDTIVDFSNASLYVAGIQTVFSICTCACVSVLSCWLSPSGGGVSAVRTLALCSAAGAALMHQPLRFGRAHGVTVVFASLQLAVPLYLGTLVVAQLIHTCTSDPSHAPSWRHVVFHAAVVAMICAGFMRARAPLAETDRPFILTVCALLVIAILPPPAVALVGPLCESVTLWEAADRVVRAFGFGTLYCVNVYALTSTTNARTSDTSVIFFRSASASIWVAGAMLWWLPLAAAQAAIVIHARVSHDPNAVADEKQAYKKLDSAASTDDEDVELGSLAPRLSDPVAEQERLLKQRPVYADDTAAPVLGKIVNVNVPAPPATSAAGATVPSTPRGPPPRLSSPTMLIDAEPPMHPVGPLAFQPVTFSAPAPEPAYDAFSASVAKAMANEPGE